MGVYVLLLNDYLMTVLLYGIVTCRVMRPTEKWEIFHTLMIWYITHTPNVNVVVINCYV